MLTLKKWGNTPLPMGKLLVGEEQLEFIMSATGEDRREGGHNGVGKTSYCSPRSIPVGF